MADPLTPLILFLSCVNHKCVNTIDKINYNNDNLILEII